MNISKHFIMSEYYFLRPSLKTSSSDNYIQYPSKLLEMPEGALVTIWEIAIFQSAFFF